MKSKRGFDPRIYLDISQDHLVVLALWLLTADGKNGSFENLVAEAFESFPERFKLEGYQEWPNAHVVGKAWVRCRTDKKWLTGSASQGFKLTPLGEHIAQKTLSQLGAAVPQRTVIARKGSRQSIPARVVLRLEGSVPYQKFKDGKFGSISEYEFCELLYCTLESTPEIVQKNFSVVRQEVTSYGRDDLTTFLDELKVKFSAKFTGKRSRGGLMPQRKEETT